VTDIINNGQSLVVIVFPGFYMTKKEDYYPQESACVQGKYPASIKPTVFMLDLIVSLATF
jgi:hypothetical protein